MQAWTAPGTLEICPGESVVRVLSEVGKAVLLWVGFKDSLLIVYEILCPNFAPTISIWSVVSSQSKLISTNISS